MLSSFPPLPKVSSKFQCAKGSRRARKPREGEKHFPLCVTIATGKPIPALCLSLMGKPPLSRSSFQQSWVNMAAIMNSEVLWLGTKLTAVDLWQVLSDVNTKWLHLDHPNPPHVCSECKTPNLERSPCLTARGHLSMYNANRITVQW